MKLQLASFSKALHNQLPDTTCSWFTASLDQLTTLSGKESHCTAAYLRSSAMARRKLGTAPLALYPNPSRWQVDEAGRLLLLSKRIELSKAVDTSTLVKECFQQGDENEQIAILKGLHLIDDRGRLAELAITAGRTNSISLFAAIALNNPYPARFYGDRAFHQLVLKALFMALPLQRLTGLKHRLSPRLSTLCMELVHERLAANRNPPPSAWLAINPRDLNKTDRAMYQLYQPSEHPEKTPQPIGVT